MRHNVLLSTVAAVALMTVGAATTATTANATIIFDPNPGPALPGQEENVIFEAPDLIPGTTQIGDTNRTQTNVIFDTTFAKGTGSMGGSGTGQFLVADGIGHANLVCTTGGTACFDGGGTHNTQLTSLEMKPEAGFGWGDAQMNLDFGEGTANVFVTDNMGNNFSFTLGNGQNKFNLLGTNGEVITDIQVTQLTGSSGPFGFDMLKQPDISNVCTLTGNGTCTPIIATPEPTSLAVMGVGLLGLTFFARRRRDRNQG
jgi:hypothetical protein